MTPWYKIWRFTIGKDGFYVACPLFALEFAYKRHCIYRDEWETGWILDTNPRPNRRVGERYFWRTFKDVVSTTEREYGSGQIRVFP